MKRIIILLIAIHGMSALPLPAQTPEQNLQKYWNYRERLRKYFIAVSPSDEQGANIPASSIGGSKYDDFYTGDGNGTMQYYIGVLATEYRLLRLHGLNYTQTRNELLYALRAVERLDRKAERYFRSPQQEHSGDLNGFFIRDDVDESIKLINNNLGDFGILSTFLTHTNNGVQKPYEQSKDNVWHYLLNLALVKGLVDDSEIVGIAQSIAARMVSHMHHTDWVELPYCCPPGLKKYYNPCWRIINPVTGADVEDGARVDEIGWCQASIDGFNYGFAEAAGWITGQDLHYGESEEKEGAFINGLTFGVSHQGTILYLWDSYSYRSLAATMGLEINQSLYQYLVNRSYLHYPYEHLALIYVLLHGKPSDFTDLFTTEFNRYEHLLNVAPLCGTYNFGSNVTFNGLQLSLIHISEPTRPY